MLAKRTSKNQITIPKDVIKRFEDVEYFDIYCRDDEIVLKPVLVRDRAERLARIRQKVAALGGTSADVKDAIRAARK